MTDLKGTVEGARRMLTIQCVENLQAGKTSNWQPDLILQYLCEIRRIKYTIQTLKGPRNVVLFIVHVTDAKGRQRN